MIIIAVRSGESINLDTLTAKARHCSHCFQYYLASSGAGFFLPAFCQSKQAEYPDGAGRRIWIQVVRGNVAVNGQTAGTRDAFAI